MSRNVTLLPYVNNCSTSAKWPLSQVAPTQPFAHFHHGRTLSRRSNLKKPSRLWTPIRRRIRPKVRSQDACRTWLGLTSFIVIVRFKAIGNAPIMKQNFYKITSSNRFQAVIQFLRKELGWQASEPLVCIPTSFTQFIH
jgi:hypothetical protein